MLRENVRKVAEDDRANHWNIIKVPGFTLITRKKLRKVPGTSLITLKMLRKIPGSSLITLKNSISEILL